MVFNVTFNNISVTLWWSVLLAEETVVQEKTDKLLSHNVISSTPRQLLYDHHDPDMVEG
jgi:hypothetical protein